MAEDRHLDGDRVWVKAALDRWIRRGLSDWRDICAVREWMRRHSDIDFNGAPYSTDPEWRGVVSAKSDITSMLGNLRRNFSACECLMGAFDERNFPGGVRITLGNVISANIASNYLDVDVRRQYLSLVANHTKEIYAIEQRQNWDCCRRILCGIICDYHSKVFEEVIFERVFYDFAEIFKAALGNACLGWQEAENWAQRALVRGVRAPKRALPPTNGRRLQSRIPPRRGIDVQLVRSAVSREPGDGLSDAAKARVDKLIAEAVAGALQIDLPDGPMLLDFCGSTSERLWRLGHGVRRSLPDEEAPLAAERVWCAVMRQSFSALSVSDSSESPDARYFRGRCLSDAARLQPQVDKAAADPDAMLRLAVAANEAGVPLSVHRLRHAYERAAAGHGWTSSGARDGRRASGLPFVRAGAELGSCPMLELVGDEGLNGSTGLFSNEQAVKALYFAHDLGSANASDQLAGALERGQGVAQNMPEAQFFYRQAFITSLRAATEGDCAAMIRVGDAYHTASWLPPEAAWVGPQWAEDARLVQWNHDFVSQGARHALTWYLRAAQSTAPFSATPQRDDLPKTLDKVGQLALTRAARLIRHGLGVAAAPKMADELLTYAGESGSAHAWYQLALAKWRRWPGSDYVEAAEMLEDIEDAQLHAIADLLEKAAPASPAAAVYLWHIAGLETPEHGPDRFMRSLDPPGLAAYEYASQLDRCPTPLHIVLAVAGPRDASTVTSKAATIRQLWHRARSRGYRPTPAIEQLFLENGRLEQLLAYDPVAGGLFSHMGPSKSACQALLAAPQAVHAWLDRHDRVPWALVDWLELRAQLAADLSDPRAALWARAAARCQIRTAAFHSIALKQAWGAFEVEERINVATAATGPLWNALDKSGFPIPGTVARNPRQSIVSRVRASKRAQKLGIPRDDWPAYAPHPLRRPAYTLINSIHIRDNAKLGKPLVSVDGKRDDGYGLISLEDIMVILALVFLPRDDGVDPSKASAPGPVSLSLEPLAALKDAKLPWRLWRRRFSPSWIGATAFGQTLYITDYLLSLASTGATIFSYRSPMEVLGAVRRFEPPQPWLRAAQAGGTSAYMQGLSQFRLSQRHKPKSDQPPPSANLPLEVKIPAVSAMIYGAGWNLKPSGEEDRQADDDYWRNYYMRRGACRSANFMEMRKAFPVYERGALLFAIYAELSDTCGRVPLPPTSQLFKRLSKLKDRYTKRWNLARVAGDDDIVWSD